MPKNKKATKTNFYWAMRNNDGTEAGFQQYLLNIVDHYLVNNESPLFFYHSFQICPVLVAALLLLEQTVSLSGN